MSSGGEKVAQLHQRVCRVLGRTDPLAAPDLQLHVAMLREATPPPSWLLAQPGEHSCYPTNICDSHNNITLNIVRFGNSFALRTANAQNVVKLI